MSMCFLSLAEAGLCGIGGGLDGRRTGGRGWKVLLRVHASGGRRWKVLNQVLLRVHASHAGGDEKLLLVTTLRSK